MTALRILGRASSINVRKVLWTADECGLAYDHEAKWGSPDAPTSGQEFLAINPNGLVPVLIDEIGPVFESNAICRYLAARAGRRDLLPPAPEDRARVEMWMDWQATELNSAWRYAFMGLVRRAAGYDDPDKIARSAERWNRKMRVLNDRLALTGAYVAGAAFSLADVVVGLSAHRWRSTPIEHARLPAVMDWIERLALRPAFRRWSGDP